MQTPKQKTSNIWSEPTAKLNNQRILVTGASGFLGAHLIARLERQGAVVAGLARTHGRLDQIPAANGCLFLPCDLTDSKTTLQAIQRFKPQTLFHLAAQPDGPESFEHTKTTLQTNLIGTLNVLEAFRHSGGQLLIYGDSSKIYGNGPVPYREETPTAPNSSYAITKAGGWSLCQLYAKLYGFHTVSLRPSIIYGPLQNRNLIQYVTDCVLDGQTTVTLDGGSQTRDPLFIDDAVDAMIATVHHGSTLGGRVINIGGGHEIAVRDLATIIVQEAGGGPKVVCRDMKARPTELWRSWCDNIAAGRLIGWHPQTPLRDGLRQTIQAIKAARCQLATVSDRTASHISQNT